MMFGRKRNSDALALLATEALTAKVMVADENFNIVYMNEAVKALLREAEADLKKDLPRFSVDTLIGTNIDAFHKNPSHQRQMLQTLKSVHRATIKIGQWTFDLLATPLKRSDGSRAGTAVEWADASIRLQNLNYAAQAAAVSRSQAVIEFNLDGTVITANDNFLNALGYTLGEIQGKHHGMFVSPAERDSTAYREFWAALNRGEFQAAEYKRIGKGGKDVWILASYNPVLDEKGKPFKVVKFATDVTAQKTRNADLAGQIDAIGKSQAVIEFKLDGTIIQANENFLRALGYTLGDIAGRHHSMFIDQAEREGPAYREFWAALGRGEFQAGEFKRIGKGGREVWIQASYNPILDLNGKPLRSSNMPAT